MHATPLTVQAPTLQVYFGDTMCYRHMVNKVRHDGREPLNCGLRKDSKHVYTYNSALRQHQC